MMHQKEIALPRYNNKYILSKIFFFVLTVVNLHTTAHLLSKLQKLKEAYPDHIHAISEDFIIWKDGHCMPAQDGKSDKTIYEKLNFPSLAEQLEQVYEPGIVDYTPKGDPGRVRYEPFFRKMYGNSRAEVESNLVEIEWMPRVFGGKYRLKVTKINSVHEKLQCISQELEELVFSSPQLIIFLDRPGGTYCWRMIANTNRLSNHSFGMTIDINAHQSQYWQWDLEHAGKPIVEEIELTYRNRIAWDIVLIFEKYRFIWGGKWYHYDTMHFEYRPELFL